ncbi:uncharacterized protein LOC128398006 [Panonychus citri]|uniref:uncharacterized protein LOC128398006 n=1 Tax=Panonychus citri TaxID=50023 RepID=UPI0023080CC4|nr:uncharacterized protein LOC128398006 [Panonychus citri]
MVLTRKQSSEIIKSQLIQSSYPIDCDEQFEEKAEEKGKSEKRIKFPEKLWNLVESDEIESIKWSKNGRAIGIDPKELQYGLRVNLLGFKTVNFSSFTRQLNLYGFRKINCETDYHEYEHPYFTKDKIHLKKLKRNKKINYESDSSSSTSSSPITRTEIKLENSQFDSMSETTEALDENVNHEEIVDSKAEERATIKCFGSFYSCFDYYGKSKSQEDLIKWDSQFTEDQPANAYFF